MAIQTIGRRGSRCKMAASRFSRDTVRWNSIWNNEQEDLAAAVMRPQSPFLPMLSSSSSPVFNNYYHGHHHQRSMSTQPFYGTPLPPSTRYNSPQNTDQNIQQQQQHHLSALSPLQRIATLVHSSLTALNDPTRADAVAAVGEVTGSYALSKMMAGMESNAVGRRILKERPLVNELVVDRAMELLKQHDGEVSGLMNGDRENNRITFGAAYAKFLQTHEFNPNGRSPIRFLSDPNLSYVMTRYRQNHDYYHVLTGLPPTVLGELALKWLELMQTGLPLAALSATSATLGVSGLSGEERDALWNVYLPWAVRVGGSMKADSLMCVYYEEELETDLIVLRERMGIEVAPVVKL